MLVAVENLQEAWTVLFANQSLQRVRAVLSANEDSQ